MIVDIGVGNIIAGVNRAEYEYEKFKIGDYVEISLGWIDLEEIIN